MQDEHLEYEFYSLISSLTKRVSREVIARRIKEVAGIIRYEGGVTSRDFRYLVLFLDKLQKYPHYEKSVAREVTSLIRAALSRRSIRSVELFSRGEEKLVELRRYYDRYRAIEHGEYGDIDSKETLEKDLTKLKDLKLGDKDRIVFFLGAGASKPEPSSIPTINEMLKKALV